MRSERNVVFKQRDINTLQFSDPSKFETDLTEAVKTITPNSITNRRRNLSSDLNMGRRQIITGHSHPQPHHPSILASRKRAVEGEPCSAAHDKMI